MSPRISFSLFALLVAAASGPVVRLEAREPNEKAARILEPLIKRPGSGALFERFVNAWLDSGTLEELGQFLTARVASAPTTANRLLLALFHSRQGESVKALEQFRVALTSDPGSAEIWFQKALQESRTLDFESAIVSLQKCLALRPAGEIALQAAQQLGKLQARAGRAPEALATWKALLESRPDDTDLREDILELQMGESLWSAARENAESLVAKTADPYQRILRRMRLGDVLDRSGQREQALAVFTACLEDSGAGSWLEKEILSQIERLFRREDDLAGLRAFFTRLLEKNGQRAGLQRAQARLLMEAGEQDAAVECGRALLALSPGDRAVREEFIALLAAANRSAEAIPQVEQLLSQNPDDGELRLTLADLKHAAKDDAGALAALREYASRMSGKEGVPVRVAGLMDRYGMIADAIQTLRAALQGRDQAELRNMLASLLHKSGDKAAALTEWKALAASGTAAVLQSARAMQAHGEVAAAWDLMQAALPAAGKDSVFLTQLCALADNPERAAAALPAAAQLVEMSRSGPDLNAALDTAQRVARLSGQEVPFAEKVAATAVTAQAFCLLATLREAVRDTAGANAALEKAREMAPELALAQLVRLWSMRGDFTQAAGVAETLFQSPGGRQGHVAEMLVSLHQRAGNPEAALRWAQEWRRLVPGAPSPVLTEARLLESLGRDAEALAALRSAAGRFENNLEIRTRLASLSLETGRMDEALRYYSALYEEAVDLSGKMKVLPLWGQAAQRAGQMDNLISRFEERRRENRGSPAPLMALAELHRITENYEARRAALTEAARLKPDDPEIVLEIARLEWRENDGEAAVRTLRGVLGRDTTGRVAAELADILISMGQLDEGLKLLTGTAATSPAAVENAAQSLAQRDQAPAALTFLKGAMEAFPEDGRLQFLAALLEWHTNDYQAAVKRLIPLTAFSGKIGPVRPGLASAAPGPLSWNEAVLQILPPETQRFFRLLIDVQILDPQPSFGFGGGYGRSLYLQLPADPDELQRHAAALVLIIAQSVPPDLRREWLSALEARGFEFAGAFLNLPSMRGLSLSRSTDSLEGALRAAPDNRALLLLAAFNAAYREDHVPGVQALMEKTWNTLKRDFPRAAVFLTLPMVGRQKTPAAWEGEVLAAAEKLPDGVPQLVYSLVTNLGEAPGWSVPDSPDGTEEDAGERRRRPLLARWLAAMNAAGGIRPGFPASARASAFNCLARRYAGDGDAAALAALLDSEWALGDSGQAPAQSGSDAALARPLGFPPAFLPGARDTVITFLNRYFPREVAEKTAPLIRDPLLRVFAAGKAGNAATEAAVKEVMERPGDSAVPWILGAAWAEKRGDFALAGERAVKALYLPVPPEIRRNLDGALVWWALRKSRPGEPLYLAGREAALRLRRDATSERKAGELATLLDKLGLTDEADRLMRQGKAAVAASKDRLPRLLEDGKFKEALPQLQAQLRAWARDLVTYGSLPAGSAVAEWRGQVQSAGLLPQITAALIPPRPTPRQSAECGAVYDLLGDDAKAVELYEQAIAAGVHRKVPLLLLRLVARRDPGRGLSLLKQFPELWDREPVSVWAPAMVPEEENLVQLEDRVAYCKFITKALEALPEQHAGSVQSSLLLELAAGDTRSGDFGRTRESNLDISEEAPAPERERLRRLHEEWMAGCEALARRLLQLPNARLETLAQLQTIWRWRGKQPGGLLADGMRMVVSELKAPPGRSSGGSDEEALEAKCQELMSLAAAEGRTAEFAETVVRAVKETRSPEAAAQLIRAWPLYECPAERFSAVARELVAAAGREAWMVVIPAAAQRRLGADLSPALEELWMHPEEGDSDDEFLFGDWLDTLGTQQGRAAAEAFFHRVVNGLLGPAAGRKELPAKAADTSLRSLERLLVDVGQAPNPGAATRWCAFAMRWVRDEWVPLGFGVMPLSESLPVTALTEARNTRDPAVLRTFVDALPVFDEVKGFYCPSRELLERISDFCRSLEPAELSVVFGPPGSKLSFGRRLVLGFHDPGGLCSQLAGSEREIDALPEQQRKALRSLLLELRPAQPEKDDLPALAFYEWLTRERRDSQAAEITKKLDEFLSAARGGEYESEEKVADELKPLLRDMADALHPRTREVIAAAAQAVQAAGIREPQGEILKLAGQLGSDSSLEWRDRKSTGALLVGGMAALLRSGAGGDYGIGISLSSEFRHYLESDGDPQTAAGDFLEWLGPWLQPGEARLMVPLLLERYYTHPLSVEAMVALRGKTPWEELRLEAEMALRLVTESPEPPKPGARPEVEHYAAFLRDPAVLEMMRLATGVGLVKSAGRQQAPAEIVLGNARLLRHLLEARQPVPYRIEAAVMESLVFIRPEARDADLEKQLLRLTTLPRQREVTRDWRLRPSLMAVLDMALRHGDSPLVDRLLGMEGSFPGVGALVVLARRGESGRLAALLKSRPELLQQNEEAYHWPLARFDAELAAQLPGVVREIEDPVVRFEALATFMSRSDTTPFPEGLKSHRDRCEEVAAAAAGVPWRSPHVKDRAVDTTVWEDELPVPSSYPLMEEAVQRVPLVAHIHGGGGSTITGFHAALITRALTAGDGGPLLNALRAVRELPSPRPEAAGRAVQQMLRNINTWLLDAWPALSPAVRTSICGVWRQAALELKVPEWELWCAGQLTYCIALHALAGETAAFRDWCGTLTEMQRGGLRKALRVRSGVTEIGGRIFQSEIVSDEVLELAAYRMAKHPGEPAEKAARLRQVFLAVTVNPLVSEPARGQLTGFFNLEGASPEDFLLLEEPILAAYPDSVAAVLEFADQRSEKEPEPALKQVESALKKMPPGWTPEYAGLLDLRVRILEKLGRGAEAEPAVRELLAMPEPYFARSGYESERRRLVRWLKAHPGPAR